MTDPAKPPLTGIAPAAARPQPVELPIEDRGPIEPLFDEPLPSAADSSRYELGPLFSRKVLVGWALAALALWFTVTFVVPEVVSEVKRNFLSEIDEPGSVTRAGGVTITRNADGSVTVTRGGEVIVTTPPDPKHVPAVPKTLPPGGLQGPVMPSVPNPPDPKKIPPD